MEYIETLPSSFGLIQDDEHFKLGTDSILLAFFCGLKRGIRVFDIGCGTGAIGLFLAGREKTSVISGIDILPTACDLARRSIELSGLTDRVNIIDGDAREIKKYSASGAYDLVVSNPPYFKAGGGGEIKGKNIAAARAENSLTADELCKAAAYLLRWGGNFCVVYRTERLADMIFAMRQNSLEPKRLRFISHTVKQQPDIFLMEAKRGGGSGLTLMPPLYIMNDDGTQTDEIRNIYGMGG